MHRYEDLALISQIDAIFDKLDNKNYSDFLNDAKEFILKIEYDITTSILPKFAVDVTKKYEMK